MLKGGNRTTAMLQKRCRFSSPQAGGPLTKGVYMSWSTRKALKTSISAPDPRWVHSLTGGVSHARRAEAPKPTAKNQAHEALITPAANPSRSPALWTAIAPPRRPTVSKTAWGFNKETPTVWASLRRHASGSSPLSLPPGTSRASSRRSRGRRGPRWRSKASRCPERRGAPKLLPLPGR